MKVRVAVMCDTFLTVVTNVGHSNVCYIHDSDRNGNIRQITAGRQKRIVFLDLDATWNYFLIEIPARWLGLKEALVFQAYWLERNSYE